MNTHVSKSYLLRRVAVRAAVGVWRNRGRLLLASLMSVALFGYVITHPQDVPSALAQGASGMVSRADILTYMHLTKEQHVRLSAPVPSALAPTDATHRPAHRGMPMLR